LRNSPEFARIETDDNPKVVLLGRIIRETMKGKLYPDERTWVNRIEALRSELLESEEILVIPMLGNGKPDAKISAEDRFVGRTVDMSVRTVCDKAAIARKWAILFLKIMHGLKPENCLELGASLGISAAYIGAGLTLNGAGRLVTLEGADSIASYARKNLQKLEISRVDVRTGWFNETLGPVLNDLGTVDYAYIDGHHFREPTLSYFNMIAPFCAENALLAFDDISTTAEKKDAWQIISNDARVGVVVDLITKGFCFISKKPDKKRRYHIEID